MIIDFFLLYILISYDKETTMIIWVAHDSNMLEKCREGVNPINIDKL